jgi:hypothetical protein
MFTLLVDDFLYWGINFPILQLLGGDDMGKRFVFVFFSVLLLMLSAFIAVVYMVDPYCQYHKPWGNLPLHLNNGRYQNAGIARNMEYDTLILGTSVSANFLTYQFDELFGVDSQKLIVLGGYFSDFSAALDIAFESHQVKRVFWGIDSNILGRNETGKTEELPEYLYNKNAFDDVHYLLNKEVFFSDITAVLRMHRTGEAGDAQSGGFLWGEDLTWSKKQALSCYHRPEEVLAVQPKDALLPMAKENLTLILHYVDAHSDTKFTFYLAPYSILFWDLTMRTGMLDATLEMQRFVLEELTSRPNVEVFYFMDQYDIMANLDNYGDHIHYSPQISNQLVEEMARSKPISKEEIGPRLQALRNFVVSYDFDSLF